jgi:hypothetical protein
MNRPRRILPVALVLGAGLLVAPLHVQRAAAYISGCETDPVLVLSNGESLALATNVATDPHSVESIVYVVHAPVGVSLVRVHSWGRLKKVESIVFVSDLASNVFATDTVVTTETHPVSVTAEVSLQDSSSRELDKGSSSGQDSQDLYVPLVDTSQGS